VAKPVATWLCLRAGAIGGLLTPAFATGAALGTLIAAALSPGLPQAEAAELALLGATAFLAVAQRIPVTAGMLALELTRIGSGFALLVALTVAASWFTAHAASRLKRPRLPQPRAPRADGAGSQVARGSFSDHGEGGHAHPGRADV
jgi:H+/Cl- antiporter ClcA